MAQQCGNMLKAGCREHADEARVASVIEWKTKHSAYEQEQARKDAGAHNRASKLLLKLQHLSRTERKCAHSAISKRIRNAQSQRSLSKCIMHIDCDMMFAACEALSNSELQHTAFAVGGMQMISTASYEARKYGVRSAMPGFVAVELCPHLRFVKPDFNKYTAKAEEVRDALRECTGDEPRCASLDEAYVDCTTELQRRGISADALAHELRQHVKQRTGGLTCSVGVAPNARLAKLASDENKPDGQYIVPFSETGIDSFLHDLPIRRLNGIGRSSQIVLSKLGINTVHELRQMLPELSLLLYESQFEFVFVSALGLGDDFTDEPTSGSRSTSSVGRKCLSQEKTFQPTSDVPTLHQILLDCVNKVASGLSAESVVCGSLTVKVKSASYRVLQRQRTLERKSNDAAMLSREAQKLFKELEEERRSKPDTDERVRLIGIRASHLEPEDASALRDKGQAAIDSMLQKKRKRQSGAETVTAEGTGDPGADDDGKSNEQRPDSANRVDEGEEGAPMTEYGDQGSIPTSAQATRGGRAQEGCTRCDKCGKYVSNARLQEHFDWHLALSMKYEEHQAYQKEQALWKTHDRGVTTEKRSKSKSHSKASEVSNKPTLFSLWQRSTGNYNN